MKRIHTPCRLPVPARLDLRALTPVALCLCSASSSPAQPIAVYESEVNAAKYSGIYQAPLRAWLTGQGYEFDVIGDEVAADAKRLGAYAVLMASSSYLVPDAAAEGIAEYVSAGGRVVWLDSPALTADDSLWQALGLVHNVTYANLSGCTLVSDTPNHPVTVSGPSLDVATLVGNWATEGATEATVLYEARGTNVVDRQETTFPAVILAEHGAGQALVYNWVVWSGRSEETLGLVADGLACMLADYELRQKPTVARVRLARSTLRQPEPLRLLCQAYRRPGAQGDPPGGSFALLSPDGNKARSGTVPLGESRQVGASLAAAVGTVDLPTAGLPDGTYTLQWRVTEGDTAIATGKHEVRLRGQQFAALRAGARERRKALAPSLVGTLGDYDAEPRTPEGRVDLPRLLEQIETAHMNMYDFLIWHAPTDWEDFQAFLPLARENGIKVWVTLCPPSEQGGAFPHSEPYRIDFLKWADEIGKLAKQYDNLAALVIDDFAGANLSLFTPDYIADLVRALRSHDPGLAFLPTIYWPSVGDAEWIEDYGPLIDGIVFPYTEYATGEDLEEQLQACRDWIGPDKFLLVNVYAAGSGGGEAPPRTAEYMRKTLTVSRAKADGIRIYCLPKENLLGDPRYAATAELYEKWQREDSK